MGLRYPAGVAPRTVVGNVSLVLGAAAVAGAAILALLTHAEKADLSSAEFSSPPAHMTLLALLLAAATALSMGPKTSPLARTAFCCMIIAGTFIPASAANSAGHVNPTAWQRTQPVAGRAGRTAPAMAMAPLPLNLALRGGDEAVLHEHAFNMRPGVTFKTKSCPTPERILALPQSDCRNILRLTSWVAGYKSVNHGAKKSPVSPNW